jgi:hypothetical protein
MLIKFQTCRAREFSRQYRGLIVTALTFPLRVQRNRNDQVRVRKWLASLRAQNGLEQSPSDERFAFQRKH